MCYYHLSFGIKWESTNTAHHKMTAGEEIRLKLKRKRNSSSQQVRTSLLSPGSSLQSARSLARPLPFTRQLCVWLSLLGAQDGASIYLANKANYSVSIRGGTECSLHCRHHLWLIRWNNFRHKLSPVQFQNTPLYVVFFFKMDWLKPFKFKCVTPL